MRPLATKSVLDENFNPLRTEYHFGRHLVPRQKSPPPPSPLPSPTFVLFVCVSVSRLAEVINFRHSQLESFRCGAWTLSRCLKWRFCPASKYVTLCAARGPIIFVVRGHKAWFLYEKNMRIERLNGQNVCPPPRFRSFTFRIALFVFKLKFNRVVESK